MVAAVGINTAGWTRSQVPSARLYPAVLTATPQTPSLLVSASAHLQPGAPLDERACAGRHRSGPEPPPRSSAELEPPSRRLAGIAFAVAGRPSPPTSPSRASSGGPRRPRQPRAIPTATPPSPWRLPSTCSRPPPPASARLAAAAAATAPPPGSTPPGPGGRPPLGGHRSGAVVAEAKREDAAARRHGT